MWFPSRIGFLTLAAFIWVNLAVRTVHGADAEGLAFSNAEKALQDGFYPFAEKKFAEFIATNPASPRVSQALLRQSEAALKQRKFEAALSLLSTNMTNAAGIADQFQFAIANIYSESGQFEAAATNYAALVARYTNSSLRLEATLNEARARFELKQWPRVSELLQSPDGFFQQSAARDPARESIVRGQLLLAQALLEQQNFPGAEQATRPIPDTALTARTKWEREFLLVKAQMGARKLEPALLTASNLVAIATTNREATLEAASVAVLGEILEALDRPEEALAAYARNQRADLPPERVREAVFKSVELTIAQGQLTNALARLEEFVAAHPNEIGADIALLTLAEVRLKQHQLALSKPNGATNGISPRTDFLSEVITNCDKLLRTFTNSPFASKAQFVRGWALFAQGKPAESLASFRTAADALPWSESQAVARFKTADLEFQSGALTNALRNYRRVIDEYKSLPRVQTELIPRARYQMFLVSLEVQDITAAEEVMEAILGEYPASGYAERALLLFGQAVDELDDPAKARKVFEKSIALFPASALRPEVELAVARTFERERDWSNAIERYDSWVTTFPMHSSLPSAEFHRALANDYAGLHTNALTLFTSFITRFPTNELAARAQNWVGDYYFNREQFEEADRNYQFVFQKWPTTPLRWEARLKAGRAALLRPSFKDAEYYFTNLFSRANEDTSCPPVIVVQALIAYGDAFRLRLSTNWSESYSEARRIYAEVPRFFPGDPLESRAWGSMAECYFQLGSLNPTNNYPKALEFYAKVLSSWTADTPARQQATVGIGHVFRAQSKLARASGSLTEATNLLNMALTNYLNVIYPSESTEAPDPFWVREAMWNAAEICKAQNQWETAYNLYLGLAEKIPPLRTSLKKEIDAARLQMEAQKQ